MNNEKSIDALRCVLDYVGKFIPIDELERVREATETLETYLNTFN